jgi:PTS system nitrogen regulatory IIA component
MDVTARVPNIAERKESPREALAPIGEEIEVAPGLEARGIMLDVELCDRRHAIETAAAALSRRHDLNGHSVAQALWQRELAGSTALGGGVAIPHARLSAIGRPVALFIRPKWAIDFDAPDGKPVGLILVVLVPSAGNPEDHLRLLKAVAEKFADPLFRAQLMENDARDDAWSSFAAWIRQLCGGSSH